MIDITVGEAAIILGCNSSRVRQLIGAGKLRAIKRGRDNFLKRVEVEKYLKTRPGPGRPPKKPVVER